MLGAISRIPILKKKNKLSPEPSGRRQLFVAIEKEKEDAKRARDEAKRQTEIAKNALAQVEIEKQTAIAAEKKAKAVLDKIYFYDDKFGLAYQKNEWGRPQYGFIDKNLKTNIEFIYDEACFRFKRQKLDIYFIFNF